jgi:hypothetical protein
MVPNNPKVLESLHSPIGLHQFGGNRMLEAFSDALMVQVSGGMRTRLAQDISEEMKHFNR